MSIVTCRCGRAIDTDMDLESVAVWSPETVCDKCFAALSPDEAWNLALKAVQFELMHTRDIKRAIAELLH